MAYPLSGVFLAVISLSALAGEGDGVPDPTRPPTAVIKSLENSREATAAPVALQSVILRPGARPAAIIAGERVELGGDFGGARLVKVSEQEVVLQGPSGREVLRLTPGVEKKPAQTSPSLRKNKKLPAKEGS